MKWFHAVNSLGAEWQFRHPWAAGRMRSVPLWICYRLKWNGLSTWRPAPPSSRPPRISIGNRWSLSWRWLFTWRLIHAGPFQSIDCELISMWSARPPGARTIRTIRTIQTIQVGPFARTGMRGGRREEGREEGRGVRSGQSALISSIETDFVSSLEPHFHRAACLSWSNWDWWAQLGATHLYGRNLPMASCWLLIDSRSAVAHSK